MRGLGLPARGGQVQGWEAGSWQLEREGWVGLAEGTKGRALKPFPALRVQSCQFLLPRLGFGILVFGFGWDFDAQVP